MNEGTQLVQALLYGKLEGLPEETVFLFSRSGLIHLFSASGFHLWSAVLVADALAWPLLFFVKGARPRHALSFASRISLMTFFGSATDWSSPMVRAYAFAVVGASARLLEWKPSRHWIFALSLLCAAVLGKGSTLSFLLSAFGMAGLLYIEPRNAFTLALGPWLFTLPITIFVFGCFSLLAPLWNLTFGLAISWFVLPPAILSLLAGTLGFPTSALDQAAASLMLALTEWLLYFVNGAGGTFWVRPWPWAIAVAVFMLAARLWHWKWRRPAVAAIAVAALAGYSFPDPVLAMLNVGQGDSVLLRTKEGMLLNDLGPPGYLGGTAPVCRSLERLGIGEVEQVLLSHFDLDHRGGLSSLLARHPVRGSLWFREEDLAEKQSMEVLAAAERAGLGIRFLTAQRAPPGLLCWLSPFRQGNDSSPLCRAELPGGESILLTGDMSERTEKWLLAHLRPFPKADILKVAHHGSRSSSTSAFLRSSGARLALIGVGQRNRYRHPNVETLARLESAGMKIERTDFSGTLSRYDWPNPLDYFSAAGLTEEIMRVGAEGVASRAYPGTPAFAKRE